MNQGIVVVPAAWKQYWWLFRLSPSLCLSIATKSFQEHHAGRLRTA